MLEGNRSKHTETPKFCVDRVNIWRPHLFSTRGLVACFLSSQLSAKPEPCQSREFAPMMRRWCADDASRQKIWRLWVHVSCACVCYSNCVCDSVCCSVWLESHVDTTTNKRNLISVRCHSSLFVCVRLCVSALVYLCTCVCMCTYVYGCTFHTRTW